MILTCQQANSGSIKESEQEEVTSSIHFRIQECENSDSEIKLAETLETLENGGQATFDDLKDLNCGITKEACTIYVISLLMLDEEKISILISSQSTRTSLHDYKKSCLFAHLKLHLSAVICAVLAVFHT